MNSMNTVTNDQSDSLKASQIKTGIYKIRNKATHKVLDIAGRALKCAQLIQFSDENVDSQKFIARRTEPGFYAISPLHSFQAVDVDRASTKEGGPIIQWKYEGTKNQTWEIIPHEGYYIIKALHSGKVMGIQDGKSEDGVPICQWELNYADNQLFSFEPIED